MEILDQALYEWLWLKEIPRVAVFLDPRCRGKKGEGEYHEKMNIERERSFSSHWRTRLWLVMASVS